MSQEIRRSAAGRHFENFETPPDRHLYSTSLLIRPMWESLDQSESFLHWCVHERTGYTAQVFQYRRTKRFSRYNRSKLKKMLGSFSQPYIAVREHIFRTKRVPKCGKMCNASIGKLFFHSAGRIVEVEGKFHRPVGSLVGHCVEWDALSNGRG